MIVIPPVKLNRNVNSHVSHANASPNLQRRASRNLFGCPQPGVIEAERKKENEIMLNKFNKRYTDFVEIRVILKSERSGMAIPDKIQQEREEYEKKLQQKRKEEMEFQEKCNSGSERLSHENPETTPKSNKETTSISTEIPKNRRENMKRSFENSDHSSCDQKGAKSQDRQKAITECYTLRKRRFTDSDLKH